jgi:dihydrolipoamide dehydrogenase
VRVGKFPFTANSRVLIVGQHEGFIKVVSDAKCGEILCTSSGHKRPS